MAALLNKARHTRRIGYAYLHTAISRFSRLAYTETLPDEKAPIVVNFQTRANAWFTAHGITHIVKIITGNAHPQPQQN